MQRKTHRAHIAELAFRCRNCCGGDPKNEGAGDS
jgi:hypothetical protein